MPVVVPHPERVAAAIAVTLITMREFFMFDP
jgi:hypothetical protein